MCCMDSVSQSGLERERGTSTHSLSLPVTLWLIFDMSRSNIQRRDILAVSRQLPSVWCFTRSRRLFPFFPSHVFTSPLSCLSLLLFQSQSPKYLKKSPGISVSNVFVLCLFALTVITWYYVRIHKSWSVIDGFIQSEHFSSLPMFWLFTI